MGDGKGIRLMIFILYGDDIHDDADALEAWTWGFPVYLQSGERVGSQLPVGTYRVKRHICFNHENKQRCVKNHVTLTMEAQDVHRRKARQ